MRGIFSLAAASATLTSAFLVLTDPAPVAAKAERRAASATAEAAGPRPIRVIPIDGRHAAVPLSATR